jgi:alpha-maltose-1-phosphate synthase
MRVALMTREYPPDVYGGAGVHVTHLARELAQLVEVEVHTWGDPRDGVVGHRPWDALAGAAPELGALRAMSVDLAMAAAAGSAQVVHSHTWYANLGGHLAKLVHGRPHVATVHSLEPLRPWKAEQLGGGYALSSFCERTALEGADAIIAVSEGMRRDVLDCYPAVDSDRIEVIYNGVDAEAFRPDPRTDLIERRGVDPSVPSVLFVGRITHQKGVAHLLDAALAVDPAAQLVLCVGAPDTPEIEADVRARAERVRRERGNLVWIEEMVPHADLVQLLTHATVFVCPSIYEPLGIVNLEAMACETAVVASAVGGIPEVVEDGVTGVLVPPADPAALAEAVNGLLADPARAAAMGRAGRARAVERFAWPAIARQTAALYERLAG